MENLTEHKRSPFWFALPIIGAAVPIAVMMARRGSAAAARANPDEKLLKRSNVDLEGAMSTALKFVPGTPIEVELDEEHGVPVWEVQVVPKQGGPTREVLIDAQSGDVLEMRAEFAEDASQK